METDIRRTSKQTRAVNLKHEVYTCCRFAFSGQMCNLAFQKGPETSNPWLRTKDNSLSRGITRVSHEKGDSGVAQEWPAVLWAPPGGHVGAAFLCSLLLAALGWDRPTKTKRSIPICFFGIARKK